MTPEETIKELESYRAELAGIMKRFVRSSDSYRIKREDDPRYRTIVIELVDLINDLIGKNKYSQLIYQLFTEGISNYFQTPSYKSIEDVISVVDSAITWINRNADNLKQKEEAPEPIKTETENETPETKTTDKEKRTIERTDLTVSDLIFSSNYKVKLLVCGVFLAGLGLGISLGASKLYKEKIIPLIDLYKTQDTPKK